MDAAGALDYVRATRVRHLVVASESPAVCLVSPMYCSTNYIASYELLDGFFQLKAGMDIQEGQQVIHNSSEFVGGDDL